MKDDGGPAFPHSRLGSDADGMTLRDYFAAKASEGDIDAHIWKGHSEDYIVADGPGRKKILQREARWTREEARYRYADAMLKARQQ